MILFAKARAQVKYVLDEAVKDTRAKPSTSFGQLGKENSIDYILILGIPEYVSIHPPLIP